MLTFGAKPESGNQAKNERDKSSVSSSNSLNNLLMAYFNLADAIRHLSFGGYTKMIKSMIHAIKKN